MNEEELRFQEALKKRAEHDPAGAVVDAYKLGRSVADREAKDKESKITRNVFVRNVPEETK